MPTNNVEAFGQQQQPKARVKSCFSCKPSCFPKLPITAPRVTAASGQMVDCSVASSLSNQVVIIYSCSQMLPFSRVICSRVNLPVHTLGKLRGRKREAPFSLLLWKQPFIPRAANARPPFPSQHCPNHSVPTSSRLVPAPVYPLNRSQPTHPARTRVKQGC